MRGLTFMSAETDANDAEKRMKAMFDGVHQVVLVEVFQPGPGVHQPPLEPFTDDNGETHGWWLAGPAQLVHEWVSGWYDADQYIVMAELGDEEA